jgi:hypothetical protein
MAVREERVVGQSVLDPAANSHNLSPDIPRVLTSNPEP